MLLGPTFAAELRAQSRRRRDFAIRSAVGLMLLIVIGVQVVGGGFSVSSQEPQDLSRLARDLFSTIVRMLGLSVLVITPAYVAGAIPEARARGTLDLLLCSRLSHAEVLLSTFAVRMIRVLAVPLLGFPIVCLFALIGGVDLPSVVAIFIALAAMVMFQSGVSLLVSVRMTRPADAVMLAYLFSLGGVGLPLIIEGPIQADWPRLHEAIKPFGDWLASLSPLTLAKGSPEEHFGQTLRLAIVAAIFLLISMFLFSGVAASRSRGLRFSQRVRRSWRTPFSFRPIHHRPDHTRPLIGMSSPLIRILVVVVCVGIALGAGRTMFTILILRQSGLPDRLAQIQFSHDLRWGSLFLLLLAYARLASISAVCITSEREGDTWLSLIATPMTGPEILRAKRRAAIRQARPFVWALNGLWLTGVALGVLPPSGWLLAMTLAWMSLRFAVSLGTLCSLLASSSSRALIVTVLGLVFCEGGYLLCCVPLPGLSPLVISGCSPLLMDLALSPPHELREVGLAGPLAIRRVLLDSLAAAAILSLLLAGAGTFLANLLAEVAFDRAADRPHRTRP